MCKQKYFFSYISVNIHRKGLFMPNIVKKKGVFMKNKGKKVVLGFVIVSAILAVIAIAYSIIKSFGELDAYDDDLFDDDFDDFYEDDETL